MGNRRDFLLAGAAGLAAPALGAADAPAVKGEERWTTKRTPQGEVRLFLWRKRLAAAAKGTILLVHGSSVQSVPAEGYGRSDKRRPVNADVATGADDIEAVVGAIGSKVLLYGSSSGALRAALYAERRPEQVARLALDAFVWTGAGRATATAMPPIPRWSKPSPMRCWRWTTRCRPAPMST